MFSYAETSHITVSNSYYVRFAEFFRKISYIDAIFIFNAPQEIIPR